MDRERHEPTFGTPDLHDIKFSDRRRRTPVREATGTSIPWGPIILAALATIAIVMGLIEWNARRQAAAMTAELMRPMNAKEQARFDAEMKKLEAQVDRELQAIAPRAVDMPLPVYRYDPLPLQPGERCINGRRFKRIEGGWQDLPTKPC